MNSLNLLSLCPWETKDAWRCYSGRQLQTIPDFLWIYKITFSHFPADSDVGNKNKKCVLAVTGLWHRTERYGEKKYISLFLGLNGDTWYAFDIWYKCKYVCSVNDNKKEIVKVILILLFFHQKLLQFLRNRFVKSFSIFSSWYLKSTRSPAAHMIRVCWMLTPFYR